MITTARLLVNSEEKPIRVKGGVYALAAVQHKTNKQAKRADQAAQPDRTKTALRDNKKTAPGQAPHRSQDSANNLTSKKPAHRQALHTLYQEVFPPTHKLPESDSLFPLRLLAETHADGRPLYDPNKFGSKARRQRKKGGHTRARVRRRLHVIRRANALILELNRLWGGCVGADAAPVGDSPLTATSRSLLEGIIESVLRLRRHEFLAVAEAADGQQGSTKGPHVNTSSYHELTEKSAAVKLHSETAAVPPAGTRAVPFAQFGVVPELHSPEGGALRETPPTAEELRKLPVVKSVERGQYPPLLRKMDAGGMLAFQEYAPKVINGIFGLPKGDGRIRIIIDMRRGNLYFNPPPKMDMLNPAWIVEIVIEGGELAVGKTDIAQYFNKIEVPHWLRQYCGLPPAWSDEVGLLGPRRRVYPTLRVLGMGFSWACVVAVALRDKLVHPVLKGVRRIGSCDSLRLGGDEDTLRGDFIDDDFSLATSDPPAAAVINAVKGALGPAGFPSKDEKDQMPDAARLVTEVVGMALTRDAWAMPAAQKLRRCAAGLRHLLRAGRCSSYVLSVVVGNMGWLMLANRPIYSVLQQTYTFIEAGLPTRPLPRTVLLEMRGLYALMPMLFQDLSRPPAGKMLASDASKEDGGSGGQGVVVAECSTDAFFAMQRHSLLAGWHTTHEEDIAAEKAGRPDLDGRFAAVAPIVANAEWKIAVSKPWQYWTDESIHLLEMRGAISAIKWVARQPSLHNTRVPIFVDSQAALGCLAKGRSSSRKLNNLCRRAAAYILVAGLRISWIWIPTKANPADKPSRPRPTRRGSRPAGNRSSH